MKSPPILHILIILIMVLSACKSSYVCDGECGNTHVLNEMEDKMGEKTQVEMDMEERVEYLNASANPLIIDIKVWDIVDNIHPKPTEEGKVQQMLSNLNVAFEPVGITFRIIENNLFTQYLTFEDLAQDNYERYYFELIKNNSADVIDLYLVDHEEGLCYVEGNVRGCQKGKGFTSTGGWTSSIVLAKEDISDMKIPVHELGHFLNLEHTFNNFDESASGANCDQEGDQVCDTPVDPGDGFGAMVNYTDCEMYGVYDENGEPYKPMINNYMGYFGACFMIPYEFTQGQIDRMRDFLFSEKRITYLSTDEEIASTE